MLGATDTTNGPDVAPEGIVMPIEVSLHEFTISGTTFKVTALLPCEAPKLAPLITTRLPMEPVLAETLVITGAGVTDELTDTLSKVAVAREEVFWLATNRPMYTFDGRSTIWFATNVQFTPSDDA